MEIDALCCISFFKTSMWSWRMSEIRLHIVVWDGISESFNSWRKSRKIARSWGDSITLRDYMATIHVVVNRKQYSREGATIHTWSSATIHSIIVLTNALCENSWGACVGGDESPGVDWFFCSRYRKTAPWAPFAVMVILSLSQASTHGARWCSTKWLRSTLVDVFGAKLVTSCSGSEECNCLEIYQFILAKSY